MPFHGTAARRRMLAASLAAVLLSCTGGAIAAEGPRHAARAMMRDEDGNRVGTVTFRTTPSGWVLLTAVFEGLPEGVHGFHVHRIGDCSPEFSQAGGHFAPEAREHGILSPDGPHVGDLPNLHVPASGAVRVEHFVAGMTFDEAGANSLFARDGTAVMVHAGPDDYETHPAGDSGPRIACGVVEAIM